jgi:hypothetical protein
VCAAGVEGGGDDGKKAWSLGVVRAGEGLLGESSVAGLAEETGDPAAVAAPRVEAVPLVPKALLGVVLGAFGPGTVGWAELSVWDVLDWSARPLHGSRYGKPHAAEKCRNDVRCVEKEPETDR